MSYKEFITKRMNSKPYDEATMGIKGDKNNFRSHNFDFEAYYANLKWYQKYRIYYRDYTWNRWQREINDFWEDVALIWINEGFIKAFYSHFMFAYFCCFVVVGLIIVSISAVYTLDERKYIATIQNRHGPARSSYNGGLLQPAADAFKMLLKEFIKPNYVKNHLFLKSAVISFIFACLFWIGLPFNGNFTITNTQYGCLFLIFVSLLHVYVILTAGWASNSKYSFLGGVRNVCQLISYDIAVMLVFVNVYFFIRDLDLVIFGKDQFILGFLAKFFISGCTSFSVNMLAETNRHPYDLSEAEAELVSGYNVEYSSMRFAMFFLSEYASIMYVSILLTLLFFSPDQTFDNDFLIEGLKILFCNILTIWLRSLLPRYRYDQLMRSCWKSHIPANCSTFFFNVIFSFFF